MKRKKTVIIVGALSYQDDLQKKLDGIFDRNDIELIFVSVENEELERLKLDLTLIPADSQRTVILAPSGNPIVDGLEYKGFPAAPLHFSDEEGNRICDYGDCWGLPKRIITEHLNQ